MLSFTEKNIRNTIAATITPNITIIAAQNLQRKPFFPNSGILIWTTQWTIIYS